MSILGINAYAYSSGIAVLDEGVRLSLEEERFNREKRTAKFPRNALAAAIDSGLGASDIELAAYPWSPRALLEMFGRTVAGGFPRSLELLRPKAFSAGSVALPLQAALGLHYQMRRQLPGLRRKRITFVSHHQAHAATAFFTSPFEEAMVVICDGVGDRSALSIWHGRDTELRLKREFPVIDSLGMLYTVMTLYLGYKPWHDEGKVMALAALRSSEGCAEFGELVTPSADGGLRFDTSYVNFHNAGEARPFTRKFLKRFGPPRRPGDPLEPRHEALAAAIQTLLEDALLHVVGHASRRLGLKRVVLGGGVALNCVANGRIARELGLEGVYVPPNPDDGGTALGAALFARHCLLDRERVEPLSHAYFGTDIEANDVTAAIGRRNATRVDHPEEVAAALLAEGRAIGWCQGRMEMGPRALGNRSILADPRDPNMKDRLNGEVKHRESYRPYAPAVLAEEVAEWFPDSPPSPFMSFAAEVAGAKASEVPAVLHVDRTARVQTVDAVASPRFHFLISAFARRTGVPVVLNTSLNDREPICRTPADAVSCFERAGLDALIIGDRVLLAPGLALPKDCSSTSSAVSPD